jgi:tetratricopeptide (TPR) repeat protein
MIIAVSIFSLAFSARAAVFDCRDLVQGSEKSWMAGRYDESDKFLKQAEQKCPGLPEIYWREARNIYDRVECLPRDQRPDKPASIELYNRIIALGEKCVALNPDDGMCCQWKAIGIGRRGSTRGVLNSLGDLRELLATLDKAESLKPSYRAENGADNGMGDIYTAHGMLIRIVPDWFILQVLFGGRGDIAKSVTYQRKAVALEPNRVEYNKELGVSLVCYGQKKNDPTAIKEGCQYLEKVGTLPVLKNSDNIDKEHARILLGNLDLACGYSRDAQQVQSKEEFEKNRHK